MCIGEKWILLLIIHIVLISCRITDKKPEVKTNAYAPFLGKIQEGNSILKDGDLVVRSGDEVSSQLIKKINRRDQNWSHSGLVFYDEGYPYIYHIVSSEENPSEKITREPLEIYSNPRKNSAFIIKFGNCIKIFSN